MSSKQPINYSNEEVCVFINSIGLSAVVDKFKENGIDGTVLVSLTDDDLTSLLGLTVFQARKFQSSLEFATKLSQKGDSDKVKTLEAENIRLTQEVSDLKAIIKALREPPINKPLSTSTSRPQPQATAPYNPSYNPTPAPVPYVAPPPPPQPKGGAGKAVVGGAAGGAAKGALLGVIAGGITGHAGKGAEIGAAVGATSGAFKGMGRNRRRQQEYNQQQMYYQQQQAYYQQPQPYY
jgi:type II secretory pathway pseudopilin PulG